MSIDIQALCSENYLPAFQIQQECHFNPWSQRVFADCLTPPYFAYQMVVNNTCCGYYVGMDVAGEATLMDIGITQTSRRKGFARVLMEHFIAHCNTLGCQEIWLEVRSSNQGAIRLYQQFEFNLIETRKDYYPSEHGREDALIMKKAL